MRFVAGRGAVAELLTGAVAELLLAWALRRSCRPAWAQRRRAIGKMLLTGAAAERLTGRYAVAKLLAGAPQWQRCCWPGRCGRAADQLGRSGKVAGRGAVAKRQAGNAAVAKRLLAGGAAAE